MNKIKNHFSAKKNYYIVAGLLALLLSLIYVLFGAWPFGTNTLAHYDLYHQIIPFLELIFDAIEGKSTIIYSNFTSGGANIVGFFCYFIFNPFYLLLLPFGSGNLWLGLSIVFMLHIIAIALVFMWFIRKYFKLSTVYQILISLSYALSPYVLFNYSFFTWLMLPLLLPILVHFFLEITRGKGFVGFTIVSACMIFNCYGIGLCGHIPLYILFTLYTFIMVSKSKRKTVMTKMLLGYGLSLAVCLFMLGPNALQLGESSRLDIFFENLWTGRLFHNVIYGTQYLLVNAVLITFNIVFLIKFKTESRFSQFLLAALVLSIIPIFIDGITLILCLGSYFGYNMRLGYILTFVMFITTIYTIKNIQRQRARSVENTDKSTQRLVGILYTLALVVSIVVALVTFELLSFVLSHSSATKHTIGFVALVFVPLITLAVIVIHKYTKGKFTHKFFTRIMVSLFAFQTILSTAIFTGEGIYDTKELYYLQEQCIELDASKSRLKDVYNSVGTNLHLATGFGSMSGSASQIHKNSVELGKIFGYYNHYNIVNSDGGTLLSDGFLGYDYYYSCVDYSDRPYLSLISTEVIEGEDMYLYRNSLALNKAILVDKDKTFSYSDDIAQNTQNLYEYLGGMSTVIRTYSLDDLVNQNLVSGENITINTDTISLIDNSRGEIGTISFDVLPSPYAKIIYMKFGKETEFNFSIEDQSLETQIYTRKLYDMGFVERDTAYSYQVTIDETLDFEDITIYELNYDKVENLLSSLKNQQVDFEYTKDGYNIHTTAHNQKLVVSNANITGNNITINGKAVTPSDLPFVELALVDGENHIESRFVYPYTKIFVICLVFGILCLVAVILINKYLIQKPKFKNFLYYTSIVAFVVAVVVVYFVPSVIFITRLCILKF